MIDITGLVFLLTIAICMVKDYIKGDLYWDKKQKMFTKKSGLFDNQLKKNNQGYYVRSWRSFK